MKHCGMRVGIGVVPVNFLCMSGNVCVVFFCLYWMFWIVFQNVTWC